MKLDIVKVEPIGTEKRKVLACPGARWIDVDAPKFPASATASSLRALRIELGLSQRVAAAALGIPPSVLTMLEFGSRTLARSEQWAEVYEVLRTAARDAGKGRS